MNRIIFGALCAIVLALPASAQQASAPLNVHAGDVYTIAISDRETLPASAGRAAQTLTISQVYRLDVLNNASDDRRWRYTPVSMDMSSMAALVPQDRMSPSEIAAMSEVVSAMMRIFADIGFECRVDEHGRCLEMSNWPVWSARTENVLLMFDALVRIGQAEQRARPAQPKEAGGDAPSTGPSFDWDTYRGPVLQALAAMLDGVDSRAAASSMIAFHPMAAIQGHALARGASERVNEQWVMPFGAPPMNMTGTLTLQSIDARAHTATFVRHATLDSASARTSMQAMIDFLLTNVVTQMEPVLRQRASVDVSPSAMRDLVRNIMGQVEFSLEETTTGSVDLTTGMARHTSSDYVLRVRDTSSARRAPAVLTDHHEITVAPGAPPAPRLPRGRGA